MKLFFTIIISMLGLLTGCRQHNTLFTRLDNGKTGINFRNLLLENNPDFNIVLYPYFYNGAGVAAGDLNNDGLDDLVFTGNMAKNRMYINKGDFEFEDVSQQAGIAKYEGWCTGVTIADINADGLQDIYICRSGLKNVNFRRNLLFINGGNNQFTEKAAEFGLDDPGYSTQASFFDFDLDGDLDMFLINQSSPEYSIGKLEHAMLRKTMLDSTLENKLFRNDGNHFTNVTHSAGISSNALTFSLGLSTADINMDGWPDIYVANDFNENDYYYLNNKDGSFTRKENEMFDHFSQYSMGCDVNDFNNDALPDLVTLDMLSEDNYAQKMHMGGDNFDKFQALFKYGFMHQYMKNTLQRNNGDGTFSEIGQLAGISATDWSWSPLLADFDNDGLKDLFITNGYKRDNTNMQFVKFSMDHALKMQQGGAAMPVADYIAKMPGILLPNYLYANRGNDAFENKTEDWGINEPSDSHGAIYADLDNDGDLDLVTNNTDEFAGVYRNNSEKNTNLSSYLQVKCRGPKGNGTGIGTKVWVHTGEKVQYQEMLPVRGYQSSVMQRLHFGLGGEIKTIDSLRVQWPDGNTQVLKSVATNQILVVNYSDAGSKPFISKQLQPIFSVVDSLPFIHRENIFNDFKQQYLLNDFLSRSGPCLAKADINNDGLEDVFVGGALGQPGAILFQQAAGGFKRVNQPDFNLHAGAEDTDAGFGDVNGDGFQDLLVASGGYEQTHPEMLENRLYLNNGKGNFSLAPNSFSGERFNTTSLDMADVDGDGDKDVFFGNAEIPGLYPIAQASTLWINQGKGIFKNATAEWLPKGATTQLVRDARFADLDGNGKTDLVVAGDYMQPLILINNGNKLVDQTSQWIGTGMEGLYKTIAIADLNNDHKPDIILGNYGLNTQFKSTEEKPSTLANKDYDGNGLVDPIFHYYIGNTSYPAMPKDDITAQVPSLNKKYLNYPDYAKATSNNLFSEEQKKGEKTLSIKQQKTAIFMNDGKHFTRQNLPIEAQYSNVCSIITPDINEDGLPDILLLGNNRYTRIKYGEYNANHGVLLVNAGNGGFNYIPQYLSGLKIRQDIRASLILKDGRIIVGPNNDKPFIIKHLNTKGLLK